jgi:hypothetical protein
MFPNCPRPQLQQLSTDGLALTVLFIITRNGQHWKHPLLLFAIAALETRFFPQLLLSNGCCIFAYLVVVAQQRFYMPQYFSYFTRYFEEVLNLMSPPSTASLWELWLMFQHIRTVNIPCNYFSVALRVKPQLAVRINLFILVGLNAPCSDNTTDNIYFLIYSSSVNMTRPVWSIGYLFMNLN